MCSGDIAVFKVLASLLSTFLSFGHWPEKAILWKVRKRDYIGITTG
jgi:hypothetical protein